MLIYIIIFLIAIISAFLMLSFRAWKIETSQINKLLPEQRGFLVLPKLYFRHIEKIMLYLAKYVIQWIVLLIVKCWFILSTKIRKWSKKNIPKIIVKFFKGKSVDVIENKAKYSFVRRAILESKIKIRHMKEKVRRDHEEDNKRV